MSLDVTQPPSSPSGPDRGAPTAPAAAPRAAPSGWRAAWGFVREVISKSLDHGIGRMAAAMAYFAMFSLPALLVFVLALAGLGSSYESVQDRFLRQVGAEVGEGGAEAIHEMIRAAERLRSASPSVMWLGIGSLVFGALGFFLQLQDALNVIFGGSPKAPRSLIATFSLKRVLGFGMTIGIAVFLLLSLALSTLLAAFGEHLAGWVPEAAPTVLATLDLVLNTALIMLLFAAVYRVVPDAPPPWHDVWLGAVVASGSFSLGKFAIGSYLARSNLASGYGAAGPLIVLLVWTYFSAIILLAGAEIARARAWHRAHRGDSPPAVPPRPPSA